MKKSQLVFTGVIIKEEKGYSALCLELDVASQGSTISEAKKNLLEAVSLYIESAFENNLPIIRYVPQDENPLKKRPSDIKKIFNIKVDLKVKLSV